MTQSVGWANRAGGATIAPALRWPWRLGAGAGNDTHLLGTTFPLTALLSPADLVTGQHVRTTTHRVLLIVAARAAVVRYESGSDRSARTGGVGT
jgi:hypothetical protein